MRPISGPSWHPAWSSDLDGAFFSSGRLPRRKLAKNLAQRCGVLGALVDG